MRRTIASLSVFCLGLTTVLGAPLKVASLSTITTDIAQNVGGDLVQIDAIVKPGIDPHEFQPTPGDLKKISNASLVLTTGKGIEGYMDKLGETTGNKKKFIDTGKAIPSLRLEEDGKMVDDPHWWHSVSNVKKATVMIRDAFIQADPAHKAEFEKNAAAYLVKLSALEKWVKEAVAVLPREKRKLVTSHDAFQYFARDYGFKIYAIEGVSTTDQPSSKKIANLIATIKAEQVKAIFFGSIENPKVSAEITKETGAKLGRELYADGLGATKAKTYPEMVKYNVTTIVDSLK